MKSYINKWKIKWKWRKTPKSEFPLMYVGLPLRVRKIRLEYGTPLAIVSGPRGARGALRYVAPDHIERVLSPRDTEIR